MYLSRQKVEVIGSLEALVNCKELEDAVEHCLTNTPFVVFVVQVAAQLSLGRFFVASFFSVLNKDLDADLLELVNKAELLEFGFISQASF